MKKLLFVSLIAFGISCKKENPPAPTPVNPVVIDTGNYIIIDGDGHNSDTVALVINQQAHFHVNGSYIGLSANSSNFDYAILLRIPATTTGTYQCIGSSQIDNGSVGYSFASANANIVTYQSVGGTINCNYSGTFKKQTDTTVVITVSGNFNVIRGSDL